MTEEKDMKRFQFGLCEWALEARGAALCKIVSEAGLEAIQLGIGKEALRGQGLLCRELQDEYMEAAEKYGLTFTSISMTVLDHISMCDQNDPAAREKAIELIFEGIRIAKRMGMPMLMCPSFNKSEISGKSAFEMTVENYRKICREAAAQGLTVTTENNMGAEDMLSLVRLVNADNFGIYFDSQNHYLKYKLSMPDLFEMLKDEVYEIHVKDGRGNDLSGALLGTGDTEFFKTAEKIVKSSYRGFIVIENYYTQPPLSTKGISPKRLLAQDVETLKKAFV